MASIYYRVESPTQTTADAIRQEQTGEIWDIRPGVATFRKSKRTLANFQPGSVGLNLVPASDRIPTVPLALRIGVGHGLVSSSKRAALQLR